MKSAVGLVLLLWLSSCGPGGGGGAIIIPPPPSTPAATAQATVDRWLDCDECTNGERQLVGLLGDSAIDALASALRGPSVAQRAVVHQKILGSYREVPGGLSRHDYVGRMLENFVARHQKRAAAGLAVIQSPLAKPELQRALDSAEVRGYRSDVVDAITLSLAVASYAQFAGALDDSSVVFGDTVKVRRGSGLSWDGDETVVLNGAPFPTNVFVDRSGDSVLRFQAIGRIGEYAVSLGRLGPSQVTQVARMRISALRATGHAQSTAPLITRTDLPQQRFLLLGQGVGAKDFYRFETGAAYPLTVSVEGEGAQSTLLRFGTCALPSSDVSLGPVSTFSGKVVDERGLPVQGASVRVSSLGLMANTDGTGGFALGPIPPATPRVTLTVAMNGYRPERRLLQTGATSVLIGMSRTGAPRRPTRHHLSYSFTMPAAACRLLTVAVPESTRTRIVRLRFASP